MLELDMVALAFHTLVTTGLALLPDVNNSSSIDSHDVFDNHMLAVASGAVEDE